MTPRYLLAQSALALTAATGAALAQGYPRKVIKLQIPFAPAGTTDMMGRVKPPAAQAQRSMTRWPAERGCR